MFNSSRTFLIPGIATNKNLQDAQLNLNKNYSFITSKMNSINLFPVEEKQTLKAEKLRFQFSFGSYSSYMTISDSYKELTIYLDDKKVRDSIIFNVNNLSADYSRDKSFLKLLFQKVVEKINKMDKEDRADMEKWLVDNFKHQEVNN